MHTTLSLEALGYNQLTEMNRLDYGVGIEQVARVIAEHKGAYEIACMTGNHRAIMAGKHMLDATGRDDFPAVGDWVVIKKDSNENKVINAILPRKTTLHKKYGGKDYSQLIAANVDVAFVVESVDRDYSLNRFDRYLVLARAGGVVPAIIINKSDLSSVNDLNAIIADLRKRFKEVDIITTSATAEQGIERLTDYIKKGKTYCFLGSSGVGKSSLINKLLKQELIKTKTIGEKTGRGKHTTTAREMYTLTNGGIIIDNPGSREVGMVDSSVGVGEVFADIEQIAKKCKFKDCRHSNEPGCAVQSALHIGLIIDLQFASYQKLQKETKHYELSEYEKRQKDKKFGKFIKNAKDDFRKFK